MTVRAKFPFEKLNSTNYTTRAPNMEAHLATENLLLVVHPDPTYTPMPLQPNSTAEERKEYRKYLEDKYAACGEIWLGIEDPQKTHVQDGYDAKDPSKMWGDLIKVFRQKKPGSRFNSYDSLFKLQKKADETLPDLFARGSEALQQIKGLRPSGFSISDLDEELACMALIRALPEQYDSFVTSLIMNATGKYKLEDISIAFQAEESQRQAHHGNDPVTLANTTASAATTNLNCNFCDIPGHFERDCKKKQEASEKVKAETKARRNTFYKKKKHNAKEAQEQKDEKKDDKPSQSAEFAGHASACLAAGSTASTNWNTDSGATSHMTPHRNWFHTYYPHIVPVRLANGSVIYSAGLGSVQFQPQIDGRPTSSAVEMHDVLHVPKLASNLLSLLSLAREKEYHISIAGTKLHFFNEGDLGFGFVPQRQQPG